MRALLTDRALLASSVAAVVLVVTALGMRWRWPLVAATASIVPMGIGFLLADADRTRFVANPFGRYPSWTVAVFVGSGAMLVAAVLRYAASTGTGRRLGVALAAYACGLFLFVPETNVLRVIPGPLIIVAVAAIAGLIRPMPLPIGLGVAAAVSWAAAIEGTARSTTLLGTAIGLALCAFFMAGKNRDTTIVLATWIVVGPALIGRTESVSRAAVFAGVAVVAGLALALWPARQPGAGTASDSSDSWPPPPEAPRTAR